MPLTSSTISKLVLNLRACSCGLPTISGISLNSGGYARVTSMPKRGICRISDCGTEIGFW